MLCKKKWVPSVPSIFQLLEPVTGLSLVFVQQGRPVGWDSRNYRRGEGSELAKSNWGVHFGHSPPEQAKMDQNGRRWRTLHGSSCVPGVSYVFRVTLHRAIGTVRIMDHVYVVVIMG